MKNKISLLLILAGTVTALAIIFSGCSNKKPWEPNPSTTLVLEMVSGPDADTVAYGSNISYSWTSRGGIGEVEYQYKIGNGDWSDLSNVTTVQIPNVTAADSFRVQAMDEQNHTATVARQFYVGSAGELDTTPPTVSIDMAPVEGSYVATGSAVTFAWSGMDDVDGNNLMYWYMWGATVSDTSTSTSVVFNNVAAADPAEFTVWAMDQSGNVSDPDMSSFIIRDATILYVDDYQWLTSAGDVDLAKERDQKQFYRDALEGYAFSEWDIAAQGMPDSSYLVSGGIPVFSSILFASDSYLGDASGTWWYDIGAPNESSIHFYLQSGGDLLVTGSQTLPWIWNNIPPLPGDLEFDYFGIDSVNSDVIDAVDSTWWLDGTGYDEPVLLPDSITADTSYFDAWVQDPYLDFTWAIKDPNTMLDLPDSMKIDVAKNGNQDDYATGVWSLRHDVGVAQTQVLFRWGLQVNNVPPEKAYYMSPVGHITSLNSGAQWTSMLNFDTYSMPLPGMRQTFRAILTQFGE